MNKILVIQTAFIGDAILATGILEKLHATFPNAQIDYLVRKGNESLFNNHPFLNNVLVWEKNNNKYKNLFKILKQIRAKNYDVVINVQRFAASGFLTAFSKAKLKIGFKKNPFSFLFNTKVEHIISDVDNSIHEIDRNQQLLKTISPGIAYKPKLYPSQDDTNSVSQFKNNSYICIAPSSVWFTKQLPTTKWIELINTIDTNKTIYLLGSNADKVICDTIITSVNNRKLINLSGKLSFLQSVALIKDAEMNYMNDSAPLHMSSSVNANTTAIYCSTIPQFGFGPLSSNSAIIQTKESLKCRPCGLHGHKKCPINTFECANTIFFK